MALLHRLRVEGAELRAGGRARISEGCAEIPTEGNARREVSPPQAGLDSGGESFAKEEKLDKGRILAKIPQPPSQHLRWMHL